MLCASYKQSRRISILNIYYLFLILFYFIFYFRFVARSSFSCSTECRSFICYSSFFFSLSSYFQNCELLYTYNVTYTWRIAVREVQSKKKLRRESFSKTPQRVGFVVPSRVVVNTLKSSLITNTRSCALLILYITKTRINIQCYKTTTCSIFSSQ